MFNSKINLSDLKESNINQLVATDMMMIRGGKSSRCGGSKKSQSRSKGSRKGKSGMGCMGYGTITTSPVVIDEA